jgi:hypothetical protein
MNIVEVPVDLNLTIPKLLGGVVSSIVIVCPAFTLTDCVKDNEPKTYLLVEVMFISVLRYKGPLTEPLTKNRASLLFTLHRCLRFHRFQQQEIRQQ